METVMTVIIIGAAIFFWCIKPSSVRTNKKTDVLEFFSNRGYTLQNVNYYYDIGGIIEQEQEKHNTNYFCARIAGKNGNFEKYKLSYNDIYDLLVGSFQDDNEYCYFFKKKNSLICSASYGKAYIEILFDENLENLKEIKFEELKKYIGFTPRRHYS